ncbi:nuclease-related domain-containing protein [Natranaerobius thermophilus]|uniref:NERD domain protein n=2 Tax=Natranaerobius TaxID=375928 RepID=B2A868_NATTJ|nr:nuclease-related domain-containing protein [Natranaerobius thermophilus]ACB84434.1 NERD domain protein [Natranaerobius thermophilus JW/NM-WN-LF]
MEGLCSLIFLGFIGFVIYNFFMNIKGYFAIKKTNKIMGKAGDLVTDEDVDQIIKTLKGNIPNHPKYWNNLKSHFSMVNNSEHVSYSKKERLKNLLIKKGVHVGGIKLKKNRKEIKEENFEIGNKGEEEVKHNLNFMKVNGYHILNNVKLSSPAGRQEIDHIIIGETGIFHVETKAFKGQGKIVIDEDGNWFKEMGNKTSVIKNPIAQVDRHDSVIKNLLKNQLPGTEKFVTPVIVIATESFIIKGRKNCPVTVLKAEELSQFVKNYDRNEQLDEETVKKVYQKLNK